jgi:PhnB protein
MSFPSNSEDSTMADSTTQAPTTQTITAYLRVRGAAEAIAYYEKAFGAVENPGRMTMPSGKIGHASITIGNSEVMLSDESEEWDSPGPAMLGGTTFSISMVVPNVDEVFARAVELGARSVYPVADQFYGHRSGRLYDPFGHCWVISTVIEQVSPEEMDRRAEAWAAENVAQS